MAKQDKKADAFFCPRFGRYQLCPQIQALTTRLQEAEENLLVWRESCCLNEKKIEQLEAEVKQLRIDNMYHIDTIDVANKGIAKLQSRLQEAEEEIKLLKEGLWLALNTVRTDIQEHAEALTASVDLIRVAEYEAKKILGKENLEKLNG